MVKRVFRYLKGTRSLNLNFCGKLDNLQAYSDASFADCKNSLTTCGYVMKLFGDAIAWRTHKKPYVALSTCQAEYVAMSEACQELMALSKSIAATLNKNFYPMILWCNNRAAEASVKTTGGNKLRHMVEVKEHYVKQCSDKNFVIIKWVKSKEQPADVFTKSLAFELHKELVDEIMNN